jgi:hypothetical protein
MLKNVSLRDLRLRRSKFILLVVLVIIVLQVVPTYFYKENTPITPTEVLSQTNESTDFATVVLDRLQVKGRAPKTGYARSQFSDGWAQIGNCDVRNLILQRDLVDLKLSSDGCVVLSGTLTDPYSGNVINFVRGSTTSEEVQIDHVVALSDAWQKGAQQLDSFTRLQFANDSLNLLAVDGSANQQKGDSDAASWLPSNKSYRCRYVARQIAVKQKYSLWVTEAEHSTMKRILNSCSDQRLPLVGNAT